MTSPPVSAPADVISARAAPGAFVSALAMVAILGLLGVATFITMFTGPGSPQDERVAQTPAFPHDLQSLRRFPGSAKFYIAQRYAGKNYFIALDGEAKMRLFGHSPTPNVLLGRDGELYLGDGEGEGNDVDSTLGTPPPDFASDTAWLDFYRTMGASFRERHIPLVQIIAPDKSAVIAEDLPDWMTPRRTPRGADMIRAVAQDSRPEAADLFALMARLHQTSPELMLYHATDTHWTELGAALAIDAALASLGRQHVPAGPPAYQMAAVQGGDLARMIGRQDAIDTQAPVIIRSPRLSCATPDGKPANVVTLDPLPLEHFICINPDAPPGYALMFMDSFGMAAVPRLTHYFRTTEFRWTDNVSLRDVDAIKPDIVVRITAARKLQSASPAHMLEGE